MRASLVNRYFFSRWANAATRLLAPPRSADDAREWLHHHYAPSTWKDLWYLLLRGAN